MYNKCQSTTNSCTNQFGCPTDSDKCPDFVIKRHDTRPPLTLHVDDCGEPIDLDNTVLEVSLWAKAKLKHAITEDDTYFGFADNIGFQQCLTGDLIVFDRVREPEQMLVTGFDESAKLLQVQRGYHGTPIYDHYKGTPCKIFRTLNSVGTTEMVFADNVQPDGGTRNVLSESKLIYEWQPNDTCLPGCYYLEFKLLKMTSTHHHVSYWNEGCVGSSIAVPSFSSEDFSDVGCSIGTGVEWVRRFPSSKEAFLIHIVDSPTSENLL